VSGGDWKDMFDAACSGDVELLRYHLDNGVDVDYAHPEYQSTALVASILAGHERVAHILLDHGADPLLRSDLEEMTPIQAAHLAGCPSVAARLLDLGVPAPEAAQTPGARSGRWQLWRRR
jgi:uncharacterized protein